MFWRKEISVSAKPLVLNADCFWPAATPTPLPCSRVMRGLQGMSQACCRSTTIFTSSSIAAVAAKRRKLSPLPPCSPRSASVTTATMAVPAAAAAGPSPEQVERAWAWFNQMGAPKYWVAPMVDQSELAFRQLCRRHGATGAYTPMLHSRLFLETAAYRAEHFTTCQEDHPLLAQFCANDPATFVRAAQYVQHFVNGVDLNLGCPQRIASRGKYGECERRIILLRLCCC